MAKPAETGLNIASNGAVTATSFFGNGSGLTNITAANSTELGGLAPSAFAQLGATSNIFTGGLTASSFTGSGSGLTNVTAANALDLGGLPPSSYQPAGSYATTGGNTFTGDQNITGKLTATGSVSGAAATFTGVVTEAGALLPAGGTATAAQGFNSQPLDSVASVFNSTGGAAQNQDFQWLAEPVGNNTSSPSGKLNLLFGANGATPTETGLSVANNGIITFATGQAFLGTGTVTSIGSGAGLTGGPITTNGSLSIAPGGVSNIMLANPALTVTAGTDLTGGGSVALGGSITLNLNTTNVPQLNTADTFTQSVNMVGDTRVDFNGLNNGSISPAIRFGAGTTGEAISSNRVTGNLDGIDLYTRSTARISITNAGLVGIGTTAPASTLDVRGAGNFTGSVTATGAVSGSGFQVAGVPFAFGSTSSANAFLGFAGNMNSSNTGTANTAIGFGALEANTTGFNNTASGASALLMDSTGSSNTASGFTALAGNTKGSFNTASGFNALAANTTAGFNTAIGASTLLNNITGTNNTALGFGAGPDSTTVFNNSTVIGAYADMTASNVLILGGITGINGCVALNNCASVNVGIGTTAPTHTFEVDSAGASSAQIEMLSTGTDAAISLNNRGTGGREYWIDSGSGSAGVGNGNFAVWDNDAGAPRLVVTSSGNVGIGTTSPDNTLSVNGSADKTGGGSWGTFSDGRLKTVNGGFTDGLSQIMKIQPIHYRYKPGNAMGIRDTEEHIGVVAQDVQKIIPEAVTENSKGYLLVNNDPIIWSMLNAIKEQQGEFQKEEAALTAALRQIKQQQSLLEMQSAAMRSLKAEIRETRESLRKVKAQVAAAQPALVARK